MKEKTSKWLKSLIAAIVTGSSNAALSILGIPAANAVFNTNIPALTAKQLGLQVFFGGFIGMCAYLKQSPVPPDDGNTNFFTNKQNTTTNETISK